MRDLVREIDRCRPCQNIAAHIGAQMTKRHDVIFVDRVAGERVAAGGRGNLAKRDGIVLVDGQPR